MKPLDQSWPIDQAVMLACLLEASAPKLGNVHPGRAFDDMHFGHFLASATAVAPIFADPSGHTVGSLVLAAVIATRQRVGCNTNLGTLLLLAPLAKAAASLQSSDQPLTADSLQSAVQRVLETLTSEDSRQVYAAIRAAGPGGLGEVAQADISQPAPACLRTAMSQVAATDAVARQYVTAFADLFQRLLPWLAEQLDRHPEPLAAIVRVQLRWLAWEPDGLIIRKLGLKAAQRIQQRAQAVWQASRTDPGTADRRMRQLDRYLRADGNRRNPGTTADLIAATLFCRLLCQPS